MQLGELNSVHVHLILEATTVRCGVLCGTGVSGRGVMSGRTAAWTGDRGPGGVQRGRRYGNTQWKNLYCEGYAM